MKSQNLSAEQKARLNSFTAGGGVIIRAGKADSGIAARAEAAAGGPRLSLEPRGHVLGQLTRKPDGRTLILHLLNYGHQAPAENVKVRLDVSGLVDLRETKDLSRWEVKVLSPDAAQPQFAGLSARERRRVHSATDRALYCGDSLGQGGAVGSSNARASCAAPNLFHARADAFAI